MNVKKKRDKNMFSGRNPMTSYLSLQDAHVNLGLDFTNGQDDKPFDDWTAIMRNSLAFRKERNEI